MYQKTTPELIPPRIVSKAWAAAWGKAPPIGANPIPGNLYIQLRDSRLGLWQIVFQWGMVVDGEDWRYGPLDPVFYHWEEQ